MRARLLCRMSPTGVAPGAVAQDAAAPAPAFDPAQPARVDSHAPFHILRGDAAAKKLVNPVERRKGCWMAKEAVGHQRFPLNKGDMVFIPRYVPHGGASKSANSMLVLTFGAH